MHQNPRSFRVYMLGERGSGTVPRGKLQDFYKLREDSVKMGKLFEDPSFAADDSNLLHVSTEDRPVVWKRPGELVKNPKLFVEGSSPFDVKPGALGNSPLMGVMACLSLRPNLLLQVVPVDQSFDENYAGIFHFRFWQYGKWVDVVIDDRLPTVFGQLTYTHSADKTEFWSALLEKAYAKLQGTYKTIVGEEMHEAMEDLTGGLSEQYSLLFEYPNLFETMKNSFKRGSLMIAKVVSDEKFDKLGLTRFHAYSITNVVHLTFPDKPEGVRLLRLRNPWGLYEWKGDWSNESSLWQEVSRSVKEEIGFLINREGEFWLSFEDFLENWNAVSICHLDPDIAAKELDEVAAKRWNVSTLNGRWVKEITAGGGKNEPTFFMNPQFRIKIENDENEKEEYKKCCMVIGLMQKSKRSTRQPSYRIGFEIYRLDDPDRAPKPLDANYLQEQASSRLETQAYTYWREKSARIDLNPGEYCVIPTTSNAHEEGEFYLRLFSDCKIDVDVNDVDVGLGALDQRLKYKIRGPQRDKEVDFTRFFNKLAEEEEEIDWRDLQSLLNYSMKDELVFDDTEDGSFVSTLVSGIWGIFQKEEKPEKSFYTRTEGFSKEICRSMIAMLDINNSGKIGFEEFKFLWMEIMKWKAVFKLHNKNNPGELTAPELWKALDSAGYTLNHQTLNVLVQRYGTKNGTIAFDDFLMCTVKLKALIDFFKDKDPENMKMAMFTLDEWMEKTL